MPEAASRFAHASTTATTLELCVGIEAYCKEGGRRDADGAPIGGVILECLPGSSGMDDEGEHWEKPASFVVYDRYAAAGHQWHRLEEPEVDLGTLAVAHNLGLLIRRLAGELAATKQARGRRRHGSNVLSSEEINLTRYIAALGKVVAGEVLNAVQVERPKRPEEESGEW
jgi:hypothetical protein